MKLFDFSKNNESYILLSTKELHYSDDLLQVWWLLWRWNGDWVRQSSVRNWQVSGHPFPSILLPFLSTEVSCSSSSTSEKMKIRWPVLLPSTRRRGRDDQLREQLGRASQWTNSHGLIDRSIVVNLCNYLIRTSRLLHVTGLNGASKARAIYSHYRYCTTRIRLSQGAGPQATLASSRAAPPPPPPPPPHQRRPAGGAPQRRLARSVALKNREN